MLSERSWRGEAVIRLLIGLFVVRFIGVLIWWALENFGIQAIGPDAKLVNMMVMTFFSQGGMILLIWYFLHDQGLTWSGAFGFSSPKAKAIFLGAFMAVAIVPIAWFLQQLSVMILERFTVEASAQELVKTVSATAKSQTSAAMIRQYIALGISVTLIAPVAEEMLFRGILYPTCKQLGFPRVGLWGTSLMFAMLHENAPAFVSFLVLALMLVWLYETTDNLLAPIVTHSLFNLANFIYLIYEDAVNGFLKRLA